LKKRWEREGGLSIRIKRRQERRGE